jgi:glyoxylase-like metal-dependent hydrolase (beta-lactamase superfamily II)
MRVIDLEHLGKPSVIGAWEVDGVVVDPGPESCAETLVAALGERPRAILLTHIHFDHAGATGALVRRWPELPVYVHERGARHMVDPERLVTSAKRLYVEEGFKELWGEVVPVPQGNLHALTGGETVLDDFRVAYTPGHASHHVAYLHEPTGRAFVGDVGGVTIPPSTRVMAPTPPPDLDVAVWEQSLDLIAAWRPDSLALTHFGAIEDVEHQLDGVRAALAEEVALASEHDLEAFVPAMEQRLRKTAGAQAETYIRAAPLDHLWLGIDRWRSKTGRQG